ncbi:MAG: biotin--[Eggerthellaceae bacterium]|nr:biotin--[acetyl-CoA-carboxylase] ligase [Eggerthellaceae bacterium]
MQMYRIERFDTVVSTNELVKHGIEMGYDEGLVCRAAEQVGGYGRQGRSWSSPRGGLYQSILLRPDVPAEQLPTLSLVVALSVRRALLSVAALMSDEVQVKWPNDVVCAKGKLVGISMEKHA